MSRISIIAAIADNNAIGKNRALLWHLPADMAHFKELTTGHAIIMGRKTFESLPNGPLPNRKNVVLTTIPEADFINCFACDSMGEALDLCKNLTLVKVFCKILNPLFQITIHESGWREGTIANLPFPASLLMYTDSQLSYFVKTLAYKFSFLWRSPI